MVRKYSIGQSRHPILCRWWVKTKECEATTPEEAVHELYVPFWAWPFEWLHRLVFGRATLEQPEPEPEPAGLTFNDIRTLAELGHCWGSPVQNTAQQLAKAKVLAANLYSAEAELKKVRLMYTKPYTVEEFVAITLAEVTRDQARANLYGRTNHGVTVEE